MRVFLTGATGFLGRYILQELLNNSHSVLALVEPSITIPDDSRHPLVTYFWEDLLNSEKIKNKLDEWKPDACIHLAWYIGPDYLSSLLNLPLMKSSVDLINNLYMGGCKQVIVAGSCAEYALTNQLLQETSKMEPATLYSACKSAICQIGTNLSLLYKANFAWGRIFYPYGPGENPNRLMSSLINAIIAGKPFKASSGTQKKDYIFVEDVARAFLCLLDNHCNGIFNISTNTSISVKEVIQIIERQMNAEHYAQIGANEKRSWDPENIQGDNQKLIKLGWKPNTTIEDGIRKLIDRCRQQSQ